MDKMCTVIAHFYAKPEKVQEREEICKTLSYKRGRNPAVSTMIFIRQMTTRICLSSMKTGDHVRTGISTTNDPS